MWTFGVSNKVLETLTDVVIVFLILLIAFANVDLPVGELCAVSTYYHYFFCVYFSVGLG